MINRRSELAELKNIGKKSEKLLNSIGLYTKGDLIKVGPVDAYNILKSRGHNVSAVMMYAIEGAIMDVHWNDLPPQIKQRLKTKANK